MYHMDWIKSRHLWYGVHWDWFWCFLTACLYMTLHMTCVVWNWNPNVSSHNSFFPLLNSYIRFTVPVHRFLIYFMDLNLPKDSSSFFFSRLVIKVSFAPTLDQQSDDHAFQAAAIHCWFEKVKSASNFIDTETYSLSHPILCTFVTFWPCMRLYFKRCMLTGPKNHHEVHTPYAYQNLNVSKCINLESTAFLKYTWFKQKI